jgi:PAS domain S-box-containing protein
MRFSKKEKLVLTLSLVIIITGVILMGIMLFDIPYFETRFPKYIQIKFNNALIITLIGAYYLLFLLKKTKKNSLIFFALSAAITLISALTLLEYLFSINVGIDQLFVRDRYGIASGDTLPGRLNPQSAMVFLFFGLSLLGFSTNSRLLHILSQYITHLISLILAVLLIGFIYNDAFFENLPVFGLNFLYEGALLFIMSVAASFLHPLLGIARLFNGNLVGNQMARRLFLLITATILFFGLIKVKYLNFQFWRFDTGFSLFIMCILLVALLIIWHTANWLNRIDAKRYEAEKEITALNERLEKRVEERTADLSDLLEKFRESELRFRSLAEKSMVGIYISQNDKFIYVNPWFAQIFGYEHEELVNTADSPVDLIICEEDRTMAREQIEQRYHGHSDNAHYQVRGLKKDGTQIYVEFFGSRVTINGATGIIGTMIDITESKRAEEELRSSEQKYKQLFESNPQALLMVAIDDRSIIAANDAAAKLYGYTRDELLMKNARVLRSEEDVAQQTEIFQRDFSGSSSDIGVVKHVRKDGAAIFVHIIAHDIMFEGKNVRLSLTTDVTEKLKAEEYLQKQEANLRTILETTDTAYALLDKQLNIMAFNQMAVKFVNLQFNTIPGPESQLADFFPKERFPQFRNYSNDVLKGKSISYEVNYPQADGAIFYFNVRMFPIKNSQDEIFGLMLEISDVTEIKKYTNAIEEQNKKFREIAWLQSHIVRAPLARMMGIINLIKDNDLDIAEHRDFLVHLSASADELDTIIRDITSKTREIK